MIVPGGLQPAARTITPTTPVHGQLLVQSIHRSAKDLIMKNPGAILVGTVPVLPAQPSADIPGGVGLKISNTTAGVALLDLPVTELPALPTDGQTYPVPGNAARVADTEPRSLLADQTPKSQPGSTCVNRSSAAKADHAGANRVGVAALVIGICGVPLFWVPFVNLLCPVLSLILGAIGIQRAGRTGTGRLPAVAGLVLAGALFLIGLFVIDVFLSLASVLTPADGGTS